MISLLALVVSAGTAVLAWQALDKAGDARDIALAGGASSGSGNAARPTAVAPGGAAPTKDAGEPVAPPTGGSTSSTAPPELNSGTVYEPKYTSQRLKLSAPSCGSMTLDLDEPRVQADEGKAELTLKNCGGTPGFELSEGVALSTSGAPGMTPTECGDKIRTDAFNSNERLPLKQGMVLCVTTSYQAAKAASEQWRLIRLEITGVGNDNSVTVNADAWNIPG